MRFKRQGFFDHTTMVLVFSGTAGGSRTSDLRIHNPAL